MQWPIKLHSNRIEIANPTEEFLQILKESYTPLHDLSPEAEDRLFPSPNRKIPELHQDWQSFVVPDLQEHFQQQQDIVQSDLRKAYATKKLTIPKTHIDAWINALTQARLNLFETHNLQEEDLTPKPPQKNTPKNRVALKMAIYAILQNHLIEALEILENLES